MRGCATILVLLSAPFSLQAREYITLVVGQTHILKVSGAGYVAVGDYTVVDVKVLPGGNEVMLTGLEAGITNVIIIRRGGGKREYVVRVLASDPHAIAKAIKEALSGVEGIRVRVAGARVILEGEVLKRRIVSFWKGSSTHFQE